MADYGEWISFFQYLAAIAAALLAIAFLAFQLRTKMWRRQPLRQAFAITTLAELAAPVFFGLMFLFPDHPWRGAGVIVGTAGYLSILWYLIMTVYHWDQTTRFDHAQLATTIVPVTTFSVLFWFPNLRWKAGVLVWMIFSGLCEAWLALEPPGDEPIEQEASDPLDEVLEECA